MLQAVYWPDADVRCEDGTVERVTVVLWDWVAREGKAAIVPGHLVDVYMTSYADCDLTIGRRWPVSCEGERE